MSDKKTNAPRTMENVFSDGKCDHCGTNFGRRSEIWVWFEHTCCSRVCVIKAKRAGDAEFEEFEERQFAETFPIEEDTGLL